MNSLTVTSSFAMSIAPDSPPAAPALRTPRRLPSLDSATGSPTLEEISESIDPTSGSSSLTGINGGVESSHDSDAIVVGESVLIVPKISAKAPSSVCCVCIGNTKFCVLDATSGCLVASHNRSCYTKFPIQPGIYLLANRAKTQAFQEPRFSIDILKTTSTEKVLELKGSKEELLDLFYAMDRSRSKAGGDAFEEVNRLKLARKIKTPAKSIRSDSIDSDDNQFDFGSLTWSVPSFVNVLASVLLEEYEDDSSDDNPSVLHTDSVQDWFESLAEVGRKLSSGIGEVQASLVDTAKSAEVAVSDLNLRVSSLEDRVGENKGPTQKLGLTVWSSLGEIHHDLVEFVKDSKASIVSVQERFADVNSDVDRVFRFVTSLTEKVQADIRAVEARLSVDRELPRTVSGGRVLPGLSAPKDLAPVTGTDVQQQVADLLRRLDALEALTVMDKTRVSIMGTTFGGVHDVHAYFNSYDGELSHGGFLDCYNLLKRIGQVANHSSTTSVQLGDSEEIKYQKTLRDINMTQDEHLVEQTYAPEAVIPPLFMSSSGRKAAQSAKSELPALASYKAWNEKPLDKGLGPLIKRAIDNHKRHWYGLINQLYQTHPEVKHLANEVLQKSIDFLLGLVAWVDDTHDTLVNGGQKSDDVWWIISKVIRTIFEDFMSVNRGLARGGSGKGRALNYIWSTLLTYQSMSDLVDKGFKNHPVVVGAYSQWLVANSGRKEASDALAVTSALQEKYSKVDSRLSALAKSQAETAKLAETAKKTADKALSK